MSTSVTDLTPSDGLDVGAPRTLTATFQDANGDPVAVNLAQVILTIRNPAGTESQYTDSSLTDGGTGIVTYTHKFTSAGRWRWRWDWSVGSDSESEECVATVSAASVTPSSLAG